MTTKRARRERAVISAVSFCLIVVGLLIVATGSNWSDRLLGPLTVAGASTALAVSSRRIGGVGLLVALAGLVGAYIGRS